jgi:AraC-like DNA-binding protein
MNIHLSGVLLLNLASTIIGLAVAVILWRFPRGSNYNNRLLSASFFFLSFAQIVGLLVETRTILEVPHFYRLGNLCGLLFMPLSWMYVRGLLKNQKLSWRDLIHLVPALVFFVDYTPFFFSTGEVKRIAIQNNLQDLNHVLKYQESLFFPPWFHLWFRNCTILLYWIMQVSILLRIVRSESREIITENRAWFSWLTVYVSLQFFTFSPFFLSLFGVGLPYWSAITIGTSIVLIFTAISLVFQPVILYGIRGWIITPEHVETHPVQPPSNHLMYIGKEKLRAIGKQLDLLMSAEKPYLKAGYSLIDLTNDLGVPLYQVSFFLNHEKGKSFHDMLNQYRVEHSRQLMINEKNRQLTLEAIAFESGFGNRNSFTTAFKKFTGHTPSAFMKEFKQNELNGNAGAENGVHSAKKRKSPKLDDRKIEE